MYSKTTWLEHCGTTAKLNGLNNLEGMYLESRTYIDAITHSSRYYTDAQAAAKFFSSSSDGSGSGLVAATLDGYTADQIIAAGSPSGVIAWWSGSEASIPSGWVLCNGLNGTPDLRDKFVVGSGSHYVKGATGGSDTVTTAATVTVAGHVLTTSEIPKHTHTLTDYYNANLLFYPWTDVWVNFKTSADYSRTTGSTGGGGSHTHPGTFIATAGQAKLPPYYAVCAIMKS
jgi:hypothetical protein